MFKNNTGTHPLLFIVPGIFFVFFAIPIVAIYLLLSKKENNKIIKFVITVVGAVFGTMVYSRMF